MELVSVSVDSVSDTVELVFAFADSVSDTVFLISASVNPLSVFSSPFPS